MFPLSIISSTIFKFLIFHISTGKDIYSLGFKHLIMPLNPARLHPLQF